MQCPLARDNEDPICSGHLPNYLYDAYLLMPLYKNLILVCELYLQITFNQQNMLRLAC